MIHRSAALVTLVVVLSVALPPLAPPAAQTSDVNPLAARIDPYVQKQRVVVMTDIANEPDDQMSMVRFLVYSNHFDVEGLVATTSTWMKDKVRPDVIRTLVDAYETVRPKLATHEAYRIGWGAHERVGYGRHHRRRHGRVTRRERDGAALP